MAYESVLKTLTAARERKQERLDTILAEIQRLQGRGQSYVAERNLLQDEIAEHDDAISRIQGAR